MTDLDMLALQLMATKASAEALARQAAVMLAVVRASAPSPPSASLPEPTPPAEPRVCDHPVNERYACPRMGHPEAFLCRVCGEEVLQP